MNNNIYLDKVSGEINHIISFLDRNSASDTYGCFDRRYWSWRIGDMPNASIQYGVYPLVWLWKNDKIGKYNNNNNLFEWILASIDFWIKIQNNNGSFNQFFPNEQSVGTTYYTLSAILYAFENLQNKITSEQKVKIQKAIYKSADFIFKNDETYGIISNHIALFAWVNYKLFKLFKEQKFKIKAEKHLEIIFKNQSEEGWFLEYEGADPGYQTQCIYYLSQCYLETNDSIILDRIKKSIENFLIYFFHPDGSFGGEYGSRNTEIIYPAGFEILKDKIPVCKEILKFIYKGIETQKIVSLDSLDDENLIRLSTNYLIAQQYYREDNELTLEEINLPAFSKQPIEKNFQDTGIIIRSNKNYYSIINCKKGGIIKIFDRKKRQLIYEDNGYFFQINNKIITNQMIQENFIQIKESEIKCVSEFYEVLNKMLTPVSNIILRLLSVSLFRILFFTDLFRKFLVRKAFTGKKKYPLKNNRKIFFFEDRIVIKDEIKKDENIYINKYINGKKAFYVKMASSNYHSDKDLNTLPKIKINLDELNEKNKIENTIEIHCKYL